EQLAQLLFRRVAGRLVERLEQLRQGVGLGQARRQRFEHLAMFRDQLAGPLQDDLALAQDERHRAEIAGAQQIRYEVLDDRDQLGAYRAVRLQLEQIEQHREHVAAQVLGVLALDLFMEILDLLVVQEVERRVEIFDRDEALTLGRRFLFDVPPHGRRIGGAAFPLRRSAGADQRRALFGALDRHGILGGQLAEGVGDELKIFRPQERQQIVGRVGLEILRLLQHAEEAHDLRILDAGLERERAD